MSSFGFWNWIGGFLLTLVLTTMGGAQTGGASTTESTPAPAQSTPAGARPSESSPQSAPQQGDNPLPIANEQSGDQEARFVFKKQVNEVVLHATVVDSQGALVTHLERPAFAVFEDGTPQTITSFRRQDVPVAIGVVVDNSGSMRDKRAQVNRAVVNLIRASNPTR